MMDLPSPEESGQLLYQAALYSNEDLLKDLLTGQYVHHLNWRDLNGRTPLHISAELGNVSCITLLIQAGAEVNLASNGADDSKTPLQLAAQGGFSEAVETLTKAGADIFAKDRNGYCALELSQMAGHQTTALSLINTIEQRNITVSELRSRLEAGCAQGDLESCIKALQETSQTFLDAVLNGSSDEDYTLLYRAAERGHVDIVRLLIDYGADGRIHPVTLYSPLYIAAYAGHDSVVAALLQKFPELSQIETFEGWLPIHAACKTGDTKVARIILTHQYPDYVLQSFSDYSGKRTYRFAFDVNKQDPDCRTALYIGCEEGKLGVVRMLLEFGVDAVGEEEVPALTSPPASQNTYEDVSFRPAPKTEDEGSDGSAAGDTPVKKARSKLNFRSPINPSLFFHPVSVDVYSKKGRTPLQVAVSGGHLDIARLLIELRGANVNLPLAITDEELAQLHPSEAEGLLCAGSGALIEGCRLGNSEMVELLLEYGATDHENRALCCCINGNHETLACRLLCRQVFPDPEYRVNKKGVDVDLQLARGQQVFPSSLFPSVPSMLNWHRAGLVRLQEDWIQRAGLELNPKLRVSLHSSSLVFAAITRIDVSKNSLDTLPFLVFQLPSLRILNASHNNLASFTIPERGRKARNGGSNAWNAVVLEEIHLHHNILPALPDELFTLIPSLHVLDASHNQLLEVPVTMWTSWKLKDLNLSFNRLSSLPSWGTEGERPPSRVSDEGDLEGDFSTGSVDEPSRSLGTDGPGSMERGMDDHMFILELKRHNLWQKSVQLSKYYDEEEELMTSASVGTPIPVGQTRRKMQRSALTSLNLGHNHFDAIPECLPCVAPGLSRLNMAGNLLTQIGPPCNFPPKLKHLDLSGNRIHSWFTKSRALSDSLCFWETSAAGSSQRSPKPHSPTPGRRSQSIARSHRSLSVASRGEPSSSLSLSASVLTYCTHKRHTRMDSLKTLILAGNRLERIVLNVDPRVVSDGIHRNSVTSSQRSSKKHSTSEADSPLGANDVFRARMLFPCLSMLDVSGNALTGVPPCISDLGSLSVLNLSDNPAITSLPPEMGLLGKLWNLNLSGCNLSDPLKTMLESKKYKTMDIVGYLRSVLEDSKPYARMKLMIVGIQGIGKTSLLEQLRQEGTVTARRQPSEGWAKRMGNKNINQKTNKGVNISTVGVDVSDWTYEPKKAKNQPVYGPVTFRTWDFGGQREYYATHQYFLSRRSLYLVVWRVTDGEAGINEILQWLVNIQARAPNSPVLIVGTHFDEILANNKKFNPSFVDDLQQTIRERFVTIQDADKKGLPKVVESVIVSSKTRYNIRHLCNIIYSAAFEQRAVGSKERLLQQKIPASYMALEEIVNCLAEERKGNRKDPVLTADQYKENVHQYMVEKYGKNFRDNAELNQATSFLHENGVVLHYDDATLKDLYFLDPQWLCDILAHVITIREINPFAKNGLMRLDDLKILFKSSRFSPTNIRNYILNLLQKFEVAMTWDNRNLLIPSLLPDEYQVRGGYPDCEVTVPVRSKGWMAPSARQWKISQKTTVAFIADNDKLEFVEAGSLSSEPEEKASPEKSSSVPIFTMKRPQSQSPKKSVPTVHATWTRVEEGSVVRVYLMAYIPTGFWSRLIIRLLSEDQLMTVWEEYFSSTDQTRTCTPSEKERTLRQYIGVHPLQWLLWQTGVEVKVGGNTLVSLKEFLPLAEVRDVDYSQVKWFCQIDKNWQNLKAETSSALEIYIPMWKLRLGKGETEEEFQTEIRSATKILAIVVELIDTLLEDWYPSLGTRFVHTSEGKLLVSRLIPCPMCYKSLSSQNKGMEKNDRDWTIVGMGSEPEYGGNRNDLHRSKTFQVDHPTEVQPTRHTLPHTQSVDQLGDAESRGKIEKATNALVGFAMEECILCAHNSTMPQCPIHGLIKLADIAPDTMFIDVRGKHLVFPEQVKRGKMLGRGAFGFVFKASVRDLETTSQVVTSPGGSKDVAMKLLQPVDPGFGARQSALTAYKAAWSKWQRDPIQYASRAYCTARQELNVLTNLRHPNIVPLVGVCPRPLALVIDLAPLGALNTLLQNYRRSGAKLQLTVLQDTISQVARALEYLHQEHIIYRDLKSENVLVWHFPPPFSQLITSVEIKLGDYGISRSVFPSGGAKGFGGTEGFMAPEIMRYNGEEEYTEKVDCFSFAMFLYELISLKLPFEGQEQVKEYMLDGGRPQLTPSELLYPCNILDLMVVSWAPQPSGRPSASQLVSISTAPEFSHLIDVVSLSDPDAAVLSGEAFTVDEGGSCSEDGASVEGLEGELWLSRADGQISIISCNKHGWLDCKNIFVNEDSFVTAMCLVEDTVWLGELTGVVRVFCAKTYCELYSFALAPHILPNEKSPKHQFSLPVASILSLASLRLVLVTTGQPGVLLLCRMTDNLGGQGNSDPVITSIKVDATEVHCVAALPEVQGRVELWTGQGGGFLSIFSIKGETLSVEGKVNHYDPPVDGVEVTRLLSSDYDGTYLWSYVFPGSILYQWNTIDRKIIAKLDCSKIVPCSESISTINIDERLSPGRCQVSALCLVEKEDGSQLYIGSTWGVVIVAEADELKPITAFRTHMEDIRVVVPLVASKKASIYQTGRGSWSSAGTTPSRKSMDLSGSTTSSKVEGGKKWHDIFSGKSHKKDKKDQHQQSQVQLPCVSSGEKGEKFVLTVGKGYRCLIQRFLDNYREEPEILDSRNKDYFAIIWRTDDWI